MGDDLVPLLHTVPGSAKRLSVSERMVWRLLRIGKLRASRVLGRTMISEAELQRFAREAEEAVGGDEGEVDPEMATPGDGGGEQNR